MKIHSRFSSNHRPITAALETGTHFYKIELPQLIDSLNDNDGNLWLIYALQEYGWNALDMDHNYFGSAIVDDIFYLCVTDGTEIEINGNLEDPETAIDDFGVDSIVNYIENATDNIIHRYITAYELNFKQVDVNDIAIKLLEDNYTFLEIVRSAEDADILSDYDR